ncbi:UdgX family uracil-DNA binding protein [Streptomyces nodosus]|uniref:UdgX family uracil-DNA binding protein n=1 Tax=Streptomyces nodosus TaxID=40318 RepID=UPI0036E10852
MSRTREGGPDPQAYDAGPYLPQDGGLSEYRRAAADCRGCPLYANATRTVFGSGDPAARLVLVGEQPGDREDTVGEPFVGPAGRVLRRALEDVGIDADTVYMTNAVKHFKFTREGRGKRRIHKAPSLRETTACRPWLVAELQLVDPDVVVALGATAGKALLGSSFSVTRNRGSLIPMPGLTPTSDEGDGESGRDRAPERYVVATLHPSAILRSDDRETAYAGMRADLLVAAEALA